MNTRRLRGLLAAAGGVLLSLTSLAHAAPFARLPEIMAELATRPSDVMCQVISYR